MDTTDPATREPPTRVCGKCSASSQTPGEFCPQCGTRYGKLNRSRRARLVIFGAPILVVIVAAAVAVALVVHHDNQVTAQKRAAHARQVVAARHRAAALAAAQAAAAARRKAHQAEVALNRDVAQLQRQTIIDSLQGSVKKDAAKDVNDGLLTGPILKVQCEPAAAVDATAPIATYTCLAANSESNGELSGYRFTATINVNAGTYTWHLGG